MTHFVNCIDEDSANFYGVPMEYTVRAASLATGVAEDRLRTWERRYGIPTPARSGTGRRLYTEADLQVIRRMAALVDLGLSAGSAAATVSSEADEGPLSQLDRSVAAVDPRVSEIVEAAGALDERRALAVLRAADAADGIESALDEVALPALVEAGRQWEQGVLGVAQEHLLSEVLRRWLTTHIDAADAPAPDAPWVLIACAEDERHDLASLALSLLVRRAGLRVTYLGGDLPTDALLEISRAVRFDAICLCATATTSLPMVRLACAALLHDGSKARLYAGGRAILAASEAEASSIAAVRLPHSLGASADLIASQLAAVRHTGDAR